MCLYRVRWDVVRLFPWLRGPKEQKSTVCRQRFTKDPGGLPANSEIFQVLVLPQIQNKVIKKIVIFVPICGKK